MKVVSNVVIFWLATYGLLAIFIWGILPHYRVLKENSIMSEVTTMRINEAVTIYAHSITDLAITNRQYLSRIQSKNFTPKGQEILKYLQKIKHWEDSTKLILQQLDTKNEKDFKEAVTILQIYHQQINKNHNLQNVNYDYKIYGFQLSSLLENTSYSLYIEERPAVMQQLMFTMPQSLLYEISDTAFQGYIKMLEKESLSK